jgi:hypothetical protein
MVNTPTKTFTCDLCTNSLTRLKSLEKVRSGMQVWGCLRCGRKIRKVTKEIL